MAITAITAGIARITTTAEAIATGCPTVLQG
jgi:hypothetical protein